MDILVIVLITTAINFFVLALVIKFLGDAILKRFKIQDNYDEEVSKYICDILDIIKYNGLVRPKKEAKDEQIQKQENTN